MKNLTYIILCCLLGLALFASMFQKTTHLWNFTKLNGVEVPAPMPALTFESYVDGSFQSGTETYLMQNFGFREPILRLYNQYLWDFYKKTYVSRGILVFGKDGWLYEPWAVEDYYQVHYHYYASNAEQMTQQLANEAKRVFQLQHILEPYGTKLFVCLVPSKDMIYPEHLPENHNKNFEDETKMSARTFYKEEYPKMGINFLDLEEYFMQVKDTADFMLFPQTGTHWSKYGALFAADTLIRYMEHLGDVNMQNLVILPRTLEDAQSADMDLESLLNLIRPLPKPQYYYAGTTTDKDSTAVMPRMIVVGDSFWWNVVYQIPVQGIFSSSPYWYYNSTIFYDPTYQSVKEVDLVNELLSSDFINLFYSTTQIYKMNNGFTKAALLALCYDPEEIDSVNRAIARGIRSDSAWMAKMEERAVSQGKPIEEVVHDEAQWLITNYPEKYFTALKDSIPTKRSKRVMDYMEMDSAAFVNREIEKIIRNIKSHETQMEEIREKSIQQGKTFEQALHDDALWIVQRQLERGTLQLPKTAREKTKK